mmetsp:Transcript_40643/g.39242  ORF Transcript_40643/g.39242 Transcript_40643/m.39242 type:complete len:108 (+) Transcript_40643:759-1082(+)
MKELSSIQNNEVLLKFDLQQIEKEKYRKEKEERERKRKEEERKHKQVEFSEKMKELQKQEKKKYDYLNKKHQHRDQMLMDIKEAIKEDTDKRKEISNLRKRDQEENF